MCSTCNNTGGLNIQHSWGYEFIPCPNTNCDYDQDKAKQELFTLMDSKLKELDLSESA